MMLKKKKISISFIHWVGLSTVFHLFIFLILTIISNITDIKEEGNTVKNKKELVFHLVDAPTNNKKTNSDIDSYASDHESRSENNNTYQTREPEPIYTEKNTEVVSDKNAPLSSSQLARTPSKKNAQNSAATNFAEDNYIDSKHILNTELPVSQLTTVMKKNILTEARNRGGMVLNTYDWEYAPYLLIIKRKIQKNIHPPFAFTHMGMVGGENLVRFKITSNGAIRDIELITSDAHYSLDQTSIDAIKTSHPLPPLPKNFPKKFLQITALFSYIINK